MGSQRRDKENDVLDCGGGMAREIGRHRIVRREEELLEVVHDVLVGGGEATYRRHNSTVSMHRNCGSVTTAVDNAWMHSQI